MNHKRRAGDVVETSGPFVALPDYELDELARELRVKGRVVELELKPLDILRSFYFMPAKWSPKRNYWSPSGPT
jgi:hypothetical protein